MDNQILKEKVITFESENPDLEKLYELGAMSYFEREFPDIKRAFKGAQKCAVCMDEGTAHKDINGEAKFCIGGSGILFTADNEESRLEKVAKLMIEQGVTNITSHGGCGAAGIAYKRDFPDADVHENLPLKIEEYAKKWSDKLADKIKELGHPAERTHILAEDMERPVEFHNARVVYYDAIGGFNPNIEIGLPMGFVIERAYLPVEYANEELRIAVNIAFGSHGFEKLFSTTFPFVIIIFAKDENELERIKNEVSAVLNQNENFKQGKIKIDGAVI
jgi:hypothetical protein